MMHRLTRSLALSAAALAACAIGAPAAGAARDRSLRVTVAPGPDQVSLVQIAFPHAGSAQLAASTLEVTAPRIFGSDYLAVAALHRGLGGARALALVANRPSPLLDPARVSLVLRARRALGAPVLQSVRDVLSIPASAGKPRLCDLALGGGALGAQQLSPLGGHGPALKGLGGAQALAQAYDIACGLANPGTLREAVSAPATGGCIPCDPAPGRACPLTDAVAALCAEPVSSSQRAAGAPTY